MNRKIYISLILSILISSMILFAGCQKPVTPQKEAQNNLPTSEQSEQTTTQAEPIRIGIHYFPTTLFWYLAEDLGYFEDEGLAVEIKYYESIPEYIDAMFNDELDIVGVAFMDLFTVWQGGYKMKAVVAADYSYGADAIITRTGLGLDDIKSLKGQKVGIEQGTVSEFFLDFALTNRGDLLVDDVEKVNYSAKDGMDAFLNNEIDAIVTYEPYLQGAMAGGDAQIIFDSTNERGLIEDVGVVEQSKLENNREAYVKAFTAYFRAIDYFKNNPDDAVAIIAKRRGITSEEYAAQLEGLYLLDLRDNLTALSVASGSESLYGSGRLILDFYKARGADEGMPGIEEVIDDSIVQEIFSNTK